MKLTLKLTLDGLMRALRAQAHRKAEEIETSRVFRRAGVVSRQPQRPARPDRRMMDGDRSDD